MYLLILGHVVALMRAPRDPGPTSASERYLADCRPDDIVVVWIRLSPPDQTARHRDQGWRFSSLFSAIFRHPT